MRYKFPMETSRYRTLSSLRLLAATLLITAWASPRPAYSESAAQPRSTITIEPSRRSVPPSANDPISIDLKKATPPPPVPSTAAAPRRRSAALPVVSVATSDAESTSSASSAQKLTTSSLAINADQPTTTALSVAARGTTQGIYSPESFRTATPEELRREIERLRNSADRLPKESPERRTIEDLISAHEIRIQTGVPVQDLVAEITAQVSELRGLDVKEPVRFRILDGDELREFLDTHLDRDYPGETLPAYEFALKVLGAVPERTDLRRMIVSLLSEQVAGLYDPQTKLLYVMRQFDLSRSLARVILAHEICHALQDQHYDILSMPLTDRSNNDRQLAAQCVLEGDATILMQDYATEHLTAKHLTEMFDLFFMDQKALNKAPYFIQRQLIFPYMGGAEFLQNIMLSKGETFREETLRKPPMSSEQILHPDKYTSRDHDEPTSFTQPDLTAKLGDGWRRAFHNVFGEFQTKTLFETWREWDVAPRAADGWDGDHYALYRKDDDYLLVWVTAWDSVDDAKDFYELFSELMRAKRYREHFEQEEFPEDTKVRHLPVSTKGTDAAPPVRLRFRISDKRVVVAISNSAATLKKLEDAEDSLIEASAGEQ